MCDEVKRQTWEMVVNADEGKSGSETDGEGGCTQMHLAGLDMSPLDTMWQTVLVWLLKTDSKVRSEVEERSIGSVTRPTGGPYEYLVDLTAMDSPKLATFQPLKALFMKIQDFCEMMPCW
jgi:hypothetical protein